jgi:membrane-bound lytic murein transglycosylase
LSDTGTPAKQTNDAAKARQLAAKKAEEKKQLLAAQAAEKQRQAEARKRVAEEKKAAELVARKELEEKKKQEQAAKAKQAAKRAEAQSVVKSAKKGSTISLFGFGQSADESSNSSTPVPTKKSPTLQVQQQTRPSAPNGVPTISGWKLNGDGSISGRISGSPNFKSGELITTSQIQKGRIESGEVVQTGSGSRYYLG